MAADISACEQIKYDLRESGEHVTAVDRQEGPYLAFLPHALPPNPPLEIGHLWRMTEAAAQALGRLQDIGKRVPNSDLMILFPTIKEAHASAGVEGTTTTLAEALGFEEVGESEQKKIDFTGIRNHLEAQRYAIRARLEHGLSQDVLLEAHRLMTKHEDPARVQPGRWRTKQNDLAGEVRGYASARYVPPPPADVKACMNTLEGFWRNPRDTPDLVVAALIHGQFEMIHPFADGNGRIGRMLILVRRFEEAGWLRQVSKGKRNREFVFQEYWDALSESGQISASD